MLAGLFVIVAVFSPVLQVYVFAPVAVIVAVCPTQIVGLFTESVKVGGCIMVAVTLSLQPLSFPVKVYVVPETLPVKLVAFKVVCPLGIHMYVVLLLPLELAVMLPLLPPLQLTLLVAVIDNVNAGV